MKQIVLYPNKILRTKTEKILVVDENLIEEVKELADNLRDNGEGAGLAAVQLGMNRRFFGVKNLKTKKVMVYINPVIENVYGEKQWVMIASNDKKEEDFLEGCLSFPNYFGTVKRFLKIDIKYQVLEDKKLVNKRETLTGYDAVVWQHEYDHLDGILFVDHIAEDNGKFYLQVGEELVKSDVKKII